jgi:hypothetical protein
MNKVDKRRLGSVVQNADFKLEACRYQQKDIDDLDKLYFVPNLPIHP